MAAWWRKLGEQRSCDRNQRDPVPIGEILKKALAELPPKPVSTASK